MLSSYLKDACVLKVLEYLTFSNYQVCFTILQYNGFQKKVKIVKFRRRKHSQKVIGHRQWFTDLQITGITE